MNPETRKFEEVIRKRKSHLRRMLKRKQLERRPKHRWVPVTPEPEKVSWWSKIRTWLKRKLG